MYVYVTNNADGVYFDGSNNDGGSIGWYSWLYSDSNAWHPYSSILETQYKYLVIYLAQGNGYASGSIYFDGLLTVDLTATFGAGNEPDKAWCDSHINYFDGTTTIYK